MEGTPLLDDYVLAATGAESPKICFLPTASGDSVDYVARFLRTFGRKKCHPSAVELFRRDERELADTLLAQDAIYVGGGNTANMLAIWRLHGVDEILTEAWNRGVVLAGVSAGANCWFSGSSTDSFGPELKGLKGGLGLLTGSFCPHYDGEAKRRKRFHEMILSGELPAGYGVDDSAALHFRDGDLHQAVCSVPTARAYGLKVEKGTIVEEELQTLYLGPQP